MNLFATLGCVLALTTLSGCGGGGDEAPPPPVPIPSAQGFWGGPAGAGATNSTVVLPDGATWTVLRPASGSPSLLVGQTAVSGTAYTTTARQYPLAGGAPVAVTVTGSLAPQATMTVAATGSTAAYTLAYDRSYESPAQAAAVTGRWTAGFGSGAVVLTLDVGSTGALTGTSTGGCGYSGTLAPHRAGVAVFDVALVESCTGVAPQSFAGIATVNAARTLLSAALVTSSQSAALVFQATR